MKREKESGVALILTLILLSILSVMAVSFMFLATSETWSSMNYRLMAQARDGAEGGLNVATNYIMNTYVPPDTTGTDTISTYTYTASPVTYSGNPVVLSSTNSGVTANYPVTAVKGAFDTNGVGYGSFTAGNTTVNYATTATLLSMRQIVPYGLTSFQTIQSWLVTSDGNINNGVRNAQVEVSAILEKPIVPVFGYAAFGQSPTCGALDWSGSTSSTGSYDSTCILTTCPGTQTYDGNLGTNGNLTENGGATVNGSLSTPRTGTGSCTAGNVDAVTLNGGSTVTGGVTALPQNITYPTPGPFTPEAPTTTLALHGQQNDCAGITGCTFVCTSSCSGKGTPSGYITLAPCPSTGCVAGGAGVYGNISVSAGTTVEFLGTTSAGSGNPAIYIINTLSSSGNNSVFKMDAGPNIFEICASTGSGCAYYPTITGVTPTVFNLTGGTVTNASLNPLNFQIQYAGTGNIKLNGGSAASGTIYAPNAAITFAGNGGGNNNWYGSVIGATVTDSGGTNIYYDRNLATTAYTVGPTILGGFTWKKF